MSITIVQQIGRDNFQWVLRKLDDVVSLEKAEIILSDTESSPVVYKTVQLANYKWNPNSYDFINFLKVILVAIVLENGAEDTYRCNISLHRDPTMFDKKDHHMAHVPPINTPEESNKTDEQDGFTKNCISYAQKKEAYYNNIICSYSWVETTYDKYVAHRSEMKESIGDLIECFVYMNQQDTVVL